MTKRTPHGSPTSPSDSEAPEPAPAGGDEAVGAPVDVGAPPEGGAEAAAGSAGVPPGSGAAAPSEAGGAGPEAGSPGEAALVALREEFEALNDRHLRLAAEFNNFRRRTEQERLDLWGKAQGDVLGRILEVLDDLQRVAAMDLGNATVEGIMEGIDLVERKFVRKLGEAGVEVLDPVGARFDPAVMEAMMRVPAETEDQDETVHQVFEKGYVVKGHLIRPARVSVLKVG